MEHNQENGLNGRYMKMARGNRKAEHNKKTSLRQSDVEDVNKKADEFIKNFRLQLRFESEKSLKRKTETRARGNVKP